MKNADHENVGFWRGRPVLVTGGTGLLGGWLVRRLLVAEAKVVCLVRNWPPRVFIAPAELRHKVEPITGDIRDQALLEAALKKYQINTVFHAAGQAIVGVGNRNPVMTFETNAQGTWCLLEACRQCPNVRQIVLTSSDKVYGEQPALPYREDMTLAGRHPYEVSKACADLIATAYAASYRLPVAVTRCANFFGGGDLNWNRIIPGTIRSVLAGQRPVIRSDGQYVRDYLYADDAAAAHMLLARCLAEEPRLAGEAFNFSHEVRLTVLELVEQITRLMNSSLTPDVRNETSLEIRAQYLSGSKARAYLGWTPQFTMEQGLQRTIDWYKNFPLEGNALSSPRYSSFP